MAHKYNYSVGQTARDEIEHLRAQLSAREKQCFISQTKMLETLDALDNRQTSHAHELQAAEQKIGILARKLEEYESVVREAEKVRDDYREVVLQLIDKVESYGDFSKWHSSHIQMTRTLHLAHQSQTAGQSQIVAPENCNCPTAYSPAVVQGLIDDIERERRAHALTRAEAECRIGALASEKAVREAELARQMLQCRCSPSINDDRYDRNRQDALRTEERARLSQILHERTRRLEAETMFLREQVEQENRASDMPRHASTRPNPSVPQGHGTQATATSSRILPASARVQESIACPVDVPSHDGTTVDDEDTMPAALAALQLQISNLHDKLKKVEAERDKLYETANRKSSGGTSDAHDQQSDAARSTERHRQVQMESDEAQLLQECIRLQTLQNSLRVKLDAVYTAMQAKENAMSEENARLRNELRRYQENSFEENMPLQSPSPPSVSFDAAFPPLIPDPSEPSTSLPRTPPDLTSIPLPLMSSLGTETNPSLDTPSRTPLEILSNITPPSAGISLPEATSSPPRIARQLSEIQNNESFTEHEPQVRDAITIERELVLATERMQRGEIEETELRETIAHLETALLHGAAGSGS